MPTDTERLGAAPIVAYEEHHFQNVEDIGVAFDSKRVWVCINGIALLRAKIFGDRLFVEFYNPNIDAAMEAESDD